MPPGDYALDPAELLAQLPFVRGLARELLRDDAAAADVAQEVTVAAVTELGRRPGLAREGALRPWLVGVTRNLARMFQRTETRRVRREQAAAASEALPSSADEAVRFEALRRVVAALGRLDAGERTLLLHRFWDGWPPRRIASELGVPVNTVRSRLQRALERMRRELGVGDRSARQRLLAPLLIAGGTTLVATKVKLAAAAVVVVALALTVTEFVRHGDGVRQDAPADTTAARPSPASAPANEVAPATRESVAAPPAPAAAPTREAVAPHFVTSVRIRGRLLAAPAQFAQWSTPIVVLPAVEIAEFGRITLRPSPDRFELHLAVAPDGRFEGEVPIDGATPRIARLLLRGDDPGFVAFERRFTLPWSVMLPGAAALAADAAEWNLEVPLFTPTVVTGTVVDATGAPRAGVAVTAFARARNPDPTKEENRLGMLPTVGSARSGDDGTFALRVSRSGSLVVVARERDRGLPATAEVEVAEMARADVGELVLRPGVVIRGRVDWSGRGAAAGATIAALMEVTTGDAMEGSILGLRNASAVADRDGRFELQGLTPGPYSLQVIDTKEGGVARLVAESTVTTVVAPADDARIELRGALVDFLVRGSGEPLADALVTVMLGNGVDRAHRGTEYWTGAEGRSALVLPPGATARWFADSKGFLQRSEEFTAPRTLEPLLVTIDLAPLPGVPGVKLLLQGPKGERVGAAGFQVRQPGDDSHHDFDLQSDDGVFTLRDLAPGRWRARIRPGASFHGADGGYRDLEYNFEVRAGPPQLHTIAITPATSLQVAARDRAGRFLAAVFKLADEHGEPVHLEMGLRVEDEHGRLEWTQLRGPKLSDEASCYVDPPLAAGRYVATFVLAGYADLTLPVVLDEGRFTELDVVMERVQ